MTDNTVTRFRSELNTFFLLVLLNMAFGALAMAFGMQYILSMILGLPVWQTDPVLRPLAGAIALIGFGLGLSWILTSTRVLRGIRGIRRESRDSPAEVPPEILTGWIVRMTARYRENQKILSRMIQICRLGGCVFVTLGVVNLIQGCTAGLAGGDGWTRVIPFMAAAINLTIGIVTILISIGFHRYSAAWDHRLEEAARSVEILQHEMEQR